MSNLLNKIRGGNDDNVTSRNQDAYATAAGANTTTGTSNGTGSVGATGATTTSSHHSHHGHHGHVTGTDQYVNTQFQHQAQVHFAGQQGEATVTTQNQATNIEVPGQHVEATLPAKKVVVEIPERQVEVNLPPRQIQLENNPEVDVQTRPGVVGVSAAQSTGVSGTTGGAYDSTGVNTSGADRIDPKTSAKY